MELTAIVEELKLIRYWYLLEGRELTINSDHKPIADALLSEAARDNARQSRQFASISEYTADIPNLPGSSYIAANALSGREVRSIFLQSSY